MLLLLEGAPVQVAQPQNQSRGHLTFTGKPPIFITTLEHDLHCPKPGILPGDISMLLKRLKIYKFHAVLENPDTTVVPCGCCFANFILQTGRPQQLQAVRPHGLQKPVGQWTISDVTTWLASLGLERVAPRFEMNAIDGQMLVTLTATDLRDELSLTPLQARKIILCLATLC